MNGFDGYNENVIVKAKSTACSAGTTSARYIGRGTIAVPVTGTASAASITIKFKATAVSSTYRILLRSG